MHGQLKNGFLSLFNLSLLASNSESGDADKRRESPNQKVVADKAFSGSERKV